MEELDLPEDPCNPHPGYNFYTCVQKHAIKKVFWRFRWNVFYFVSYFQQVGCRTRWNYWSDQSTPFCINGQQYRWTNSIKRQWLLLWVLQKAWLPVFRLLDDFYEGLFQFRYEDIRKTTGCRKPCKYLRYTVWYEERSWVDTPHFTISVLVNSRH